MNLSITTTQVDETRHFVRLNDDQIKAILAKAVADQSGLVLGKPAVRLEKCYLSSQSGIGSTKYEATIEIVVDRAPATCNKELDRLGQPRPKSCRRCGLGECTAPTSFTSTTDVQAGTP